jgi:hypothetical protein
MTTHVVADHEERRRHALARERPENGIGRALIGAIVEGQVQTTLPWATFDGWAKDQIHPHHPSTRL